jgi:hypothetical protein
MLSIKNIFYFLLICLFSSCANSVIERAPWNNTPVPVVYSIISPNETVQVYLNRTYNQNFPAVKNPYPEAQVYMCGPDNNWIKLTRLSPDTCIFEDNKKLLIVEKGKTYLLKVVLGDRTVQAQTTVIPVPALIIDASCVLKGDSNIRFIFDSQRYDTLLVNNLSIKYSLPGNKDCEYLFSANSEQIYGTRSPNQGSFQSTDFGTPKDSTSFTLELTTVDPYYKKYLDAESINSLSNNYSNNSPILALIQSFGGVLPQFSNIVNGVGLFGNTVTDRKRITIKPLAK